MELRVPRLRFPLDALIAEAVKDRDASMLERELQTAGVSACRVARSSELPQDAGLRHIGFFQQMTRDVVGTYPQKTWPFRFSSIDVSHRRPPPLLGEHTAEVFAEVLGLPEAEIAKLADGAVTDNVPAGATA